VLVVLAGLARIVRSAGEVVRAGEPLGAMGPIAAANEDNLNEIPSFPATEPAQALYLEVLRDGRPEDPAAWFALDD